MLHGPISFVFTFALALWKRPGLRPGGHPEPGLERRRQMASQAGEAWVVADPRNPQTVVVIWLATNTNTSAERWHEILRYRPVDRRRPHLVDPPGALPRGYRPSDGADLRGPRRWSAAGRHDRLCGGPAGLPERVRPEHQLHRRRTDLVGAERALWRPSDARGRSGQSGRTGPGRRPSVDDRRSRDGRGLHSVPGGRAHDGPTHDGVDGPRRELEHTSQRRLHVVRPDRRGLWGGSWASTPRGHGQDLPDEHRSRAHVGAQRHARRHGHRAGFSGPITAADPTTRGRFAVLLSRGRHPRGLDHHRRREDRGELDAEEGVHARDG